MKTRILACIATTVAYGYGQPVETGFLLENVEMANTKYADVTPLEFGAEPFPKQFSLRGNMPGPVKQDENSCVAMAIGYGLYTFVKKQRMSGHFTYRMCAVKKSSSPPSKIFPSEPTPTLSPEAVFASLREHGTCRHETFGPWRQPPPPVAITEARQNRIDFVYQTIGTDNMVERIKRSLHDNRRPVPFGMEVGEEFLDFNYQGDRREGDSRIYSKLVSRMPGSKGWHFMLISGWNNDLKAFEVFNSFGEGFGHNGYIFIPYDLLKQHLKIAYSPRTTAEFGAEPIEGLTKESFDAGVAEAYCKLGIRKDRTGQFDEKLFDISNGEIASGKLTADQVLTAVTDINVRVAMPVRRAQGLVLPDTVSLLRKGDKVTLLDYSAFRVNPPNVHGTQTHYWIKVRRFE